MTEALLLPISTPLFVASMSLILLVFIAYPAILLILQRFHARPHRIDPAYTPTINIIVACHNPGRLLEAKITNSLAIDYPPSAFSVLIVSDGSSAGTAEALQPLDSDRVHGISLRQHAGKAVALNKGIEQANAEVLLFTGVDAQLSEDAPRNIGAHFADPAIGGVCGQRVINPGTAILHDAQAYYVGWDSRIKNLESKLGSATSNDGKLYALRRAAAGPFADGVTDDLYASTGVILNGFRFGFDRRAIAFVPTPPHSPTHEITRRRRVVSRSLRGLFLRRAVLNPYRFGGYAFGLLINKVLRRLLPFLLALLLVSNLALSAILDLVRNGATATARRLIPRSSRSGASKNARTGWKTRAKPLLFPTRHDWHCSRHLGFLPWRNGLCL